MKKLSAPWILPLKKFPAPATYISRNVLSPPFESPLPFKKRLFYLKYAPILSLLWNTLAKDKNLLGFFYLCMQYSHKSNLVLYPVNKWLPVTFWLKVTSCPVIFWLLKGLYPVIFWLLKDLCPIIFRMKISEYPVIYGIEKSRLPAASVHSPVSDTFCTLPYNFKITQGTDRKWMVTSRRH